MYWDVLGHTGPSWASPPPCPQMKNADYFSNYVTEDFTTYINRKRKSTCHGNHIEMQAMAEMYNRPVEVYQYGTGTEPVWLWDPMCGGGGRGPYRGVGDRRYRGAMEPHGGGG